MVLMIWLLSQAFSSRTKHRSCTLERKWTFDLVPESPYRLVLCLQVVYQRRYTGYTTLSPSSYENIEVFIHLKQFLEQSGMLNGNKWYLIYKKLMKHKFLKVFVDCTDVTYYIIIKTIREVDNKYWKVIEA